MRIKVTILTVLSVLFLLPALVPAQEKTDPGSARDKKSDKLTIKKIDDAVKKPEVTPRRGNGNNIDFPDVEGWQRGEVQNFPTAALGYSVTYESEDGGRATVYVYDGGLKSIPDGHSRVPA